MGPVALSVADLPSSLDYYQHKIGLQLQQQEHGTAVLGAGDRALLRLTEFPGARHQRRATGLFHFALLVPSRLELARTLQHLVESGVGIDGASDHRVSEALYLSDPDGHGIEIYRDRERSAWYDEQGRFKMDTLRLDLQGLLAEARHETQPWRGLHPQTVMGHVHLQVADVSTARRFYTDVLGFDHMTDYPSASFVSAGGYHHHLGMNSWNSAGAAPPPDHAARLLYFEIVLPDDKALAQVVEQVRAASHPIESQPDGWLLRDPSQNVILLHA
jgi:catechol 2,3-dioxygenase